MNYFDHKQKKIINSWHKHSEASEDFYMAFISEWIAFNAICYNLYYEKAIMERANIDRSKSRLNEIQERLNKYSNLSADDTILEFKNDKWNIDIHFPDRLFLTITKRFTEDKIFDLYAQSYSHWYNECIESNGVLFNKLKKSLVKHINGVPRYFVINMARIREYRNSNEIDELAEKNIIILCESNDLPTLKNVLYQIRCNIFHGEKTPGDLNDDRIVKSALPLLRLLVKKLMDNINDIGD